MALAEFIAAHRHTILEDWKRRAAKAATSLALADPALQDRIDEFIDEIVATLRREPAEGIAVSTARAASEHAEQRFHLGFSITSMVREYGLFELAVYDALRAADHHVALDDLRRFNQFVHGAICEAVTTFSRLKEQQLRHLAAEHQGFIAHELRNPLASARLAADAVLLRATVTPTLSEALIGSLVRLERLLTQTLIHARLTAETPLHPTEFSLPDAIRSAVRESTLDAKMRGVTVVVAVEAVTVCLDERLLRSILTNLVRNAVKFTRPGSTVMVSARATDSDRAIIEVEDECGGLGPGAAASLFAVFGETRDPSVGHGLGLAIAQQAVEAQGGTIQVHDLPGKGCVFVVDLPRVITTAGELPCGVMG